MPGGTEAIIRGGMLNLAAATRSPRVMRALTGLTITEFRALMPSFIKAEKKAQAERDANRRHKRQRKPGGGGKPALRNPEDRLLFVLVYLKAYPTQDVHAVLFGNTQAWACEWIHRLLPVLEATLGRKAVLPQRPAIGTLAALRRQCPELCYLLDATERPICRPRGEKLQREFYSGKKKRHAVKNTVVTHHKDGKVLFLGKTHSARIHDKRAAEKDGLRLPKGSVGFSDSGYQGYNPPGVIMLRPRKKRRGGKLTRRDKVYNRSLASARVAVEHTLSGVKRCRIVHDTFRNRRKGMRDSVMMIACGLHNHRVIHRSMNWR